MLVRDVRVDVDAGWTILSAALTRKDHAPRRIEYRFQGISPDLVSVRGDAFLACLIVPAMRAREDITIEAPVSATLLANAAPIMDLLSSWDTRFAPVRVIADAAPASTETPGPGVGLFFTAGVDSFYSLLKNLEEHPQGPDAITHLIHVLGYGLKTPFPPEVKKQIVAHSEAIAQETGKRHLLIETNLRDGPPTPWRMHHGSALISTVLPLSSLFGKCLIASGLPADVLVPWGMHPDLDEPFSTEQLQIMHDGLEAYRTEKMLTRIVRSELALRTLNVCAKGIRQPRNCCRCRKCLQAMVVLYSAGVLDRSPAFDKPLELKRLWTMDVQGKRYAAQKHLEVLGDSRSERRMARALRFGILRHDAKQVIKRFLPNAKPDERAHLAAHTRRPVRTSRR